MTGRTLPFVASAFALSIGGALASGSAGTDPTSAVSPHQAEGDGAGDGFVALDSPQRLADTRPDAETADGAYVGDGEQEAGSTLQLATAGRVGVPGDAGSVALNITVVEASEAGFVTAYPCGEEQPLASNLNYAADQTIAVGALVRVGSFGNVCIHNSGATDVVVDVAGYFPDDALAAFDVPQRLLDTREASATVDGLFERIGEREADTTIELDVAGRGDVPSDPDPVLLTVTADAVDAGYITTHPCDGERPTASNLNHVAGQTVANSVVSRVGEDGRVCIYTDAATHVIADVAATIPGGTFEPLEQPQRVLDTRPGSPTADGAFAGDGARPEWSTLDVDVAGRVGVPDDAAGAILNVTAVDASADGFVTVHPSDTDTPNASNLNYTAGEPIANMVVTRLGGDGSVSVHTSAESHVVVDVVGWLPAVPDGDDADFENDTEDGTGDGVS